MWGNVPQRNKYFTGREDLLSDLRRRIADQEVTALLPHALQGMGGVGKTQLAIEYAYRYQADYDVVWWISADQEALARSALAALAPRLGLTGVALGRIEDAVAAVLDALRRGDPHGRWLLVFDNADQPETIRGLMPQGPGHVLVTSRNHRWASVADTIEVNVFPRAESLAFLRRRVPHTSDVEDNRLAEELGDLPLALEQAGALLAETAMSVDTYLELLEQAAGEILGESSPTDYPVPVAAAWSLSVARVRDETPYAMDLLRRCAFFGPEPIPMELLNRGQYVLGPPLRDMLRDPVLMSRAIRALGRYALARIDNFRRTLQVHRIIQRVIRDELTAEESGEMRREVHLLLAAADPGDPDDFDNWPRYADLLAHVGPSALVESQEPEVRRLAGNIARYLYVAGDFSDAWPFAESALERWAADSGEDDPDVLIMRRHLGTVLFALSDYQAAYELNRRTLDRMREVLGDDHEETLILINLHGADLRARGDFAAARQLDEDSVQRHRQVFGDEHPRTFMAGINLALDYRSLGDYRKAFQLEDQNYRDRLDFYGRDDNPQVLFALDNLADALRHAGDYAAAREMEERTYRDYQEVVRQQLLPRDHPWVLQQAKSLSFARGKMGAFAESLELARQVYEGHQRAYGVDHPDRLAAAVSLGNAQRLVGDLNEAAMLIEDAVQRYRKVLGPDHPYTRGAVLNLAIVRRQLGDAEGAKGLLNETLASLQRSIGRDHDWALTCATNLASALADLGETEKARKLGEDTLQRFRATLGEDHPDTLACAANLALDLRALGHEQEAAELTADTLARYRKKLGEDHPDVIAVAQGQRLDLDFEPPPL
ncbi:MAG: FxSxx-COOH system tetratricopeptide repeat protein [Egibacteraceae bacterium]